MKHRILILWSDQSTSTMKVPEESAHEVMRKLKDGAIVEGFWVNPDQIRALLIQQYEENYDEQTDSS